MAVDQGGGDLPVKPCALGAGAVVRDSRVIAPRCNRQRCRRNKSQEYLHWLCRRDQHTTALTKAVTAEVRMWEGYTTARRTRVRDMRHARLEAGRVRKFKDPLLGGYLEHIGFSEALAARKFPPRLGGGEGFKGVIPCTCHAHAHVHVPVHVICVVCVVARSGANTARSYRVCASQPRRMPSLRVTAVLLALASPREAAGWHVSSHYLTSGLGHSRPPLRSTAPVTVRGSEAAGSEAAGSDKDAITTAVRRLNSSTKWLVTIAQTGAVWSRRDFVSPFLVLGAILSAFATGTLKELINESRPAGAPFADPGMPSSHALVSTFAAVGWALHLRSNLASALLLSGAVSVSVLRVSGSHTLDRIPSCTRS